ncbi:carbohydrate ABC transporter permease [Salisediminibacterium selenitireducens]|uniref:Binding-protein-dependent transport systems inner membrane component n=1 Tax=Bacillus selenitireducens (strain ATCC 700615 / DSM 15326 / MLS10) TaxID=439292 RepID=D6XVW7_BACIE|nr:carbohydrate ABC transporter permease [Salisediminibacterium selenitireducens]ADH97740.1 binding-protein-dependent transport systems inner membrane component [[Bacillus] selenitireducens MLS10]
MFQRRIKKPIIIVSLLIMALISLLPLYWVFVTALQLPSYQNEEMDRPVSYVESSPPVLYPVGITEYVSQWQKKREAESQGDMEQAEVHSSLMTEVREKTFGSFTHLFENTKIMRWLFNSVYIAVVTTAIIVLIDTMAGYVLAKKDFPGKWIIFWMIISTMMIPEQVTLVPTFIIVQNLNMFDTHFALIFPMLALAFGVFLMRQFLLSIPDELIEAAKIDGASEWKIFRSIIVPLARPAMAVLGIFTFVLVWNSFLWPIIVINDENLMTLPAGLKTLQDANLADFKLLMTGATVAAVPMIIFFLMFQRYFIKGLTIGGVKE